MTTSSHMPALTEVLLPGLVEPSGLQLQQRPIPAPGPGQALVRVEATGVSFAEQGMRRGRYPGQPKFPFVPGYDLVGTVLQVGPGTDQTLLGLRVAAATKTGGWATHALVPATDLVPVPASLDPAEAETVIVNGITAWQMLHRHARVQAGQTILVHGANGGVGSLLVQLARHAGLRVIGTAAPRHHAALRALGAEPLDYAAPDLDAQIRALAPEGMQAVFDHLGLDSARRSFRLLNRGGTLVVYGTAANLKASGSVLGLFARMIGQLLAWNVLPNGRRATFYDFWGGKTFTPATFRRHQHHDLGHVLDLLAQGTIRPQIAARFPLQEVSRAMELAESRTVLGKVILLP
ncbi:medium chain dehydrogenase/reductase family protein (plasmid) [Deinococcus sp. KNUC1210]|uniref:medium chain dehydrogenase/reductase family protein n=1 Tax=Deinococcus sp. KNUC1210 TaxID=2917691 RepID=UPI001EEFACA9|nr:medium chain dehydrogenase/reductase family protein [Deinococcus sp. KNUC1210]ULH17789.1 medium chain dehydrogenase/reductase family protein [Deinococcus sp. KNUC1210]